MPTFSRGFAVKGILEPEKYHAAIAPRMLFQHRSNMVFTGVGKEVMSDVLRKIPFIVSFTMEIDETAEFADIVFPDVHYLEQLGWRGSTYHTGSQPEVFYGAKPAVKPPFEPPWDQMVNTDAAIDEGYRAVGEQLVVRSRDRVRTVSSG